VVRNVEISAVDWGSDGSMFEDMYGTNQGSEEKKESSTQGAAGVCLGFVNFGGRASHSSAEASGQSSGFSTHSFTNSFGAKFDKGKLSIPGAQIVAFLSDIVPACPELDNPAQT